MDRGYFKHKLLEYLGNDLVACFKKANAIIAGGAIRSLFCGEDIKDVDTYFRSSSDLIGFINDYRVKSKQISTVTKRSLTFKESGKTVQLIYFSHYSSAEEIFNDFDFTACMGAYDFQKDDFVFHEDFFSDNATKKMGINKGTKYPLISMLRLFKYKQKGYDFPLKELLELCKAINKFDYSDEKVVLDQTQGFYGIVEGEKQLEWSIDELEFIVSNKIEYFVNGKNKINAITLEKIDETELEKYKDKLIEVEFKPLIVYKYVKPVSDGVWCSYYKNSFQYKINSLVKAEGSWNEGIYCSYVLNNKSTYHDKPDAVQIAMRVDSSEDIIDFKRVKRAFVLGPVDKYGNIITEEKKEMEFK